jgi:excisionase family DNA binding protein
MAKIQKDLPQQEGLNIKQGAVRMGTSVNTFRKLLDSGEIFYRKIGRRVIIAKSEIDRYMAGR